MSDPWSVGYPLLRSSVRRVTRLAVSPSTLEKSDLWTVVCSLPVDLKLLSDPVVCLIVPLPFQDSSVVYWLPAPPHPFVLPAIYCLSLQFIQNSCLNPNLLYNINNPSPPNLKWLIASQLVTGALSSHRITQNNSKTKSPTSVKTFNSADTFQGAESLHYKTISFFRLNYNLRKRERKSGTDVCSRCCPTFFTANVD